MCSAKQLDPAYIMKGRLPLLHLSLLHKAVCWLGALHIARRQLESVAACSGEMHRKTSQILFYSAITHGRDIMCQSRFALHSNRPAQQHSQFILLPVHPSYKVLQGQLKHTTQWGRSTGRHSAAQHVSRFSEQPGPAKSSPADHHTCTPQPQVQAAQHWPFCCQPCLSSSTGSTSLHHVHCWSHHSWDG